MPARKRHVDKRYLVDHQDQRPAKSEKRKGNSAPPRVKEHSQIVATHSEIRPAHPEANDGSEKNPPPAQSTTNLLEKTISSTRTVLLAGIALLMMIWTGAIMPKTGAESAASEGQQKLDQIRTLEENARILKAEAVKPDSAPPQKTKPGLQEEENEIENLDGKSNQETKKGLIGNGESSGKEKAALDKELKVNKEKIEQTKEELEKARKEFTSMVSVEILGQKVGLPPSLAVVIWEMIFLGLCVYLWSVRRQVWSQWDLSRRSGQTVAMAWWLYPPVMGKAGGISQRTYSVGSAFSKEWGRFACALSALVIWSIQIFVAEAGVTLSESFLKITPEKTLKEMRAFHALTSAFELWLLCLSFLTLTSWMMLCLLPRLRSSRFLSGVAGKLTGVCLVLLLTMLLLSARFYPADMLLLRSQIIDILKHLPGLGFCAFLGFAMWEIFLAGESKNFVHRYCEGRRSLLGMLVAGGAAVGGYYVLNAIRFPKFPRYVVRRRLSWPLLVQVPKSQKLRRQFVLEPKLVEEVRIGAAEAPTVAMTAAYITSSGELYFAAGVSPKKRSTAVEVKSLAFTTKEMKEGRIHLSTRLRVPLSRSSAVFERAAAEAINDGKLEEAVSYLDAGISHDYYYKRQTGGFLSLRLWNLLAQLKFAGKAEVPRWEEFLALAEEWLMELQKEVDPVMAKSPPPSTPRQKMQRERRLLCEASKAKHRQFTGKLWKARLEAWRKSELPKGVKAKWTIGCGVKNKDGKQLPEFTVSLKW